MATTKRPNPAVRAAQRRADSTKVLASFAAGNPKLASTAANLKNLADERQTTADKIKKNNPMLIEQDDE